MPESALELEVHLIDGRHTRYVQSDPEQAERILQDLRQRRIFDAPLLCIAGDYSLTGLSTRSVLQIDFHTETSPGWPHVAGIERIVQVDRETFELQARHGTEHERTRERPHDIGELALGYLQIDLPGDRSEYLEVHSRIQSPLEERRYLNQLFGAPWIHAERPEFGFTIYNPALIERVAALPGPADSPEGAWPAHYVGEEERIPVEG